MAKKKEVKEEILEEEKETASSQKEETDKEKAKSREEAIEIAALKKEAEELRTKLAETEDRYLRTLAEYDNFKKRSVREKEDLYFASKSDVIKKLLPVFDNFDRAQQCTNQEDYAKGVDMIIRQFFEITASMEIREIAKEGDPFDPNFHEAVFREEKEGVPENTVTQVLQKGYAVGDRVIRHAMVKVSG